MYNRKITASSLIKKGACRDGVKRVFGERKFIIVNEAALREMTRRVRKDELSWSDIIIFVGGNKWYGRHEREVVRVCSDAMENGADCTCHRRTIKWIRENWLKETK